MAFYRTEPDCHGQLRPCLSEPVAAPHSSTIYSATACESQLREKTVTVHQLTHGWQETLNARSQYSNSGDDGTAEHRINQYLIGEEIGRGSFGAVHVAVDQYGQEYVCARATQG